MPINMEITVEGIPAAIKAVQSVGQSIQGRSHQEFLRRIIVPELEKEFARCFQGGHRDWPPLKPATIRQKQRQGYPATPLVRTGAYRGASRRLRGMQISRNRIRIVSPIYYARFLEPVRPVFGEVARRMRQRIRRLYNNYVRERRGG